MHNFPNDAVISGPDSNGIYTISSQKLQKVTPDLFRFDSGLNLLTQRIHIQIDPLDVLTMIGMKAKFGLMSGDICSVEYSEGILHIKKVS